MLTLAIPVAASVASAVAFSRPRPPPLRPAPAHGLVGTVTITSTAALVAVDRGARRLLPLVALLRLSIVFPDRAPSRFSVASERAPPATSRNNWLMRTGAESTTSRHRTRRASSPWSLPSTATTVPPGGTPSGPEPSTTSSPRSCGWFSPLGTGCVGPFSSTTWAKLEVPARNLNKPGKPTEAEWVALRRHPEEGARIAAPLLGWLGPWAPAIVEHHERWDGTGYPRGLAGGDISLAGRIVAVADVFEVMTTPRPYRRPVSAGAARAELARCAGTQFDPAVVRAFLNVSLGRLRRVMGPVSGWPNFRSSVPCPV